MPLHSKNGYECFVGQTENGVVGFYDGEDKITDLYQLSFDDEGNIENMTYIKSFGFKLKVLIGRDDKLVCDQMVFQRDTYSNYEWS